MTAEQPYDALCQSFVEESLTRSSCKGVSIFSYHLWRRPTGPTRSNQPTVVEGRIMWSFAQRLFLTLGILSVGAAGGVGGGYFASTRPMLRELEELRTERGELEKKLAVTRFQSRTSTGALSTAPKKDVPVVVALPDPEEPAAPERKTEVAKVEPLPDPEEPAAPTRVAKVTPMEDPEEPGAPTRVAKVTPMDDPEEPPAPTRVAKVTPMEDPEEPAAPVRITRSLPDPDEPPAVAKRPAPKAKTAEPVVTTRYVNRTELRSYPGSCGIVRETVYEKIVTTKTESGTTEKRYQWIGEAYGPGWYRPAQWSEVSSSSSKTTSTTAVAAPATIRSTPSVSYAPVYSAPVYSAPVYSAPVYSAPVYSAPVYSAPSYARPAYGGAVYGSYSYGSYGGQANCFT